MTPLAPGAIVSAIAPASPFERPRFERGIAALRSLGLEPKFDEGIFSRWPQLGAAREERAAAIAEKKDLAYLAGDDARRLDELRAALRDPASRLLVLARGGYGAMRIASELPLDEIASAGKLLLGYSDATVLHQRWAQAGVPSLHGPMCSQLGEDPAALERLGALLSGLDPGPIRWDPIDPREAAHAAADADARSSPDSASRASQAAPTRLTSTANARAEGVLRGGNLATLASLCGTSLAPRFAGCLVLLEDLNEPPYRLDRLCTQLLQSGAFEGARGFVIGDLWGPKESSQGRAEVLAERLEGLAVPLAFGAPFGHAGRNQPVAFGCRHALDAATGTLTPLEAPTREIV